MDIKKIAYNAFQAKKQEFEWGYINWIHEPDQTSQMVIGHVIFYPYKEQEKHLHTGDEQMIYTISGRGEHWINNDYYPLENGSFYHIPPYSEHSIRNTSSIELEMIIVYNTSSLYLEELVPKINMMDWYYKAKLIDLVDIDILERLTEDLSKAIDLNISIFDEKGHLLTEMKKIPSFCIKYSKINKNCDLKNLLQSIQHFDGDREVIHSCCCELVKIDAPIYLLDNLIGYISCGPVILNNYSQEVISQLQKEEKKHNVHGLVEEYNKINIVTKGRLYAIMDSLKRINHYIVDIAVKKTINEEFQNNTLELLKQKNEKIELEKNLMEAQMKIIQSQMSPHFLFNTLGVIGQLAYIKGAKDAAETTFALSNLLRTNLSKGENFVEISEEIKYIQDYIFIQNKRFDNIIGLELSIQKDIEKQYIPFLILQILVENAIVHGLQDMKQPGFIKISAKLESNKLILKVSDNGVGITEKAIKQVYSSEEKSTTGQGTGIGLKSLLKRLKYYYKDNFSFEIKRENNGGTIFTIIIPKTNEKGEICD
ncbi:MAG: PocR ligand-binding domain-containing protein [Tissierellales bacterium]|nr:PocR ligand-binding domain-containing protein [Tissierellales bacterium]MBN2828204.1 PocR ligand-binding domain-containing protein [Tissierellales bacterium]